MAAVSQRVAARVRREFPPADAERILARLEALHAEKQSPERYQAAVVLLARGEPDRVEWAAKIDWRDAFVWSGLGTNWEPRLDEEFGPSSYSRGMTVRSVPLLASRDLHATAAFYARLGFTNKGAPHDEWDYLIIEYGGSEFHFLGALVDERSPGCCWVYADDVERVYEQWRAGAGESGRFTPLAFTNFGMRAFTMFDPDGNEVRVGQPAR